MLHAIFDEKPQDNSGAIPKQVKIEWNGTNRAFAVFESVVDANNAFSAINKKERYGEKVLFEFYSQNTRYAKKVK